MMLKPIDERITDAIADIATVANKLPGVVTIHDLRTWSVVWMAEQGLKLLNITADDINGKNIDQYHDKYFNPEDAKDYTPKLLAWLERDLEGETITYFQQVRFYGTDDWVWHVSTVKVLLRDDNNKPILAIAMSFPIDAMHHMTAKATRLLEENNFLRKNYHHFAKLTIREREVLKYLALGISSPGTAEKLFITTTTVETHRKNIKQKLDTNSYYELGMYARAFDLI